MALFNFVKKNEMKELTPEEAQEIYAILKKKDPTRAFIEDGVEISDSEQVLAEFEELKAVAYFSVSVDGKKEKEVKKNLTKKAKLLDPNVFYVDLIQAGDEGFEEGRTFEDFTKQIRIE